jgi:hypothetical protein
MAASGTGSERLGALAEDEYFEDEGEGEAAPSFSFAAEPAGGRPLELFDCNKLWRKLKTMF